MQLPPISVERIASLLCRYPDGIDPVRLRAAIRAVHLETREYWDAICNAGQLHGNIPGHVAIAIVYGEM